MSKTVFAELIIAKMKDALGTCGADYTYDTPAIAMKAIADAITEYLLANTTVTISYAGIKTIPAYEPDPIVTDTYDIAGQCAPPPVCRNFDTWIRHIESNILAGFKLGPIGKIGVLFSAIPFTIPGMKITQADIFALCSNPGMDIQLRVWEAICDDILNWLNNIAMNTTPGPATRAAWPSSGTSAITKIVVV